MRDIGHVLRGLRRSPWYAAAIVGVMGLVLTLGAAALAIVDGVLFRPLPYPDAHRLFTLTPGFEGLPPNERANASYRDTAAWTAAVPEAGITGVIAGVEVLGESVNDYLEGLVRVQPNVFDVLGVRPMIGGFSANDFVTNTMTLPAIITHDVWQGRFQGDADILGRTVLVDPTRDYGFRVVGVMPPGFVFPTRRVDARLIVPYVMDEGARVDPERRQFFEIIARLPETLTVDEARERIEASMPAVAAVFPPPGPKPDSVPDEAWRRQGPYERMTMAPLASTLGASERPAFLALFGAALLVVVLGALNASGLMAAAMVDREREFDVRRALGAPRRALARLVIIETTILFGGAALIAVVVAPALLRTLLRVMPADLVLLTPWDPADLGARVVSLVGAGSLILGMLASTVPMARALSPARRSASRPTRTASVPRSWGRSAIIAGQVAGAVLVTIVGSLLIGSVLAVYAQPVPARTRDLLAVEVVPLGQGMTRAGKSPVRANRLPDAIDVVRQLPGVGRTAVTSGRLLSGNGFGSWFVPPEGTDAPFSRNSIDLQTVTPGYFDLVAPRLTAGRFPTDDELASGAPVIVVSQTVANAYWPGASPLGRILVESDSVMPHEVVGVVEDVPWLTWEEATPSIYGPYATLTRSAVWTFLIEPSPGTAVVPDALIQGLNDAGIPVMPMRAASLDSFFRDSIRDRRFRAWLFGSIAAAGLGIVAVGMLGLVAMSSARRTREVGIRQALGSTRSGIVRLIVREESAPVLVGLVGGLLAASWLVGLARPGVGIVESEHLYGITAADPRVWLGTVGLIMLVTGIGTLVPALRASRTNPVVALRAD